MPRKGPAPKRPLVNDPVYGAPIVTQLVNKILVDGKKSLAESIVYGALEGCREKTGTDPDEDVRRALQRRVGQRFTLLKPRQGELNDQNRVFGGKPHGRQHTDLKVDIVFVSGEQRSAHGPKNA